MKTKSKKVIKPIPVLLKIPLNRRIQHSTISEAQEILKKIKEYEK